MKDIFGKTPVIGDIIAFNPPQYKRLATGKIVSFSKAGCPQVIDVVNGSYRIDFNIKQKGYYSVKSSYTIQTKNNIYILLDLEDSKKDCVHGVYSTMELALKAKESLINMSVDKDRLTHILTEEIQNDK